MFKRVYACRDSNQHRPDASGNQIIFDRLAACELSRQEVLDNNPVVLVMWSSPLRKEFLLDSENADCDRYTVTGIRVLVITFAPE